MKLSELVKFRNELGKMSTKDSQFSADLDISRISHTVETNTIQFGNFTEILKNHQKEIFQSFNQYERSEEHTSELQSH